MTVRRQKTAVILFNLGGPDAPEAVRPFLRNLFSDPAIIPLPGPLRRVLAWAISRRRAPEAGAVYAPLGGRTPLLGQSRAQAEALEAMLGNDYRCFVAMRHWRPRAQRVVRDVLAYGPDKVVLLPLYPQFSTTTTGSSFQEWFQEARDAGLEVPTKEICCYPQSPGFVQSYADLLTKALRGCGEEPVRVLFSAHGLPEDVIKGGDPYQAQVEKTAREIVLAVPAFARADTTALDWRISYQSRVGPKKWISPYTDEEISLAGQEGRGLVLVPIAFVSEHVETLVELDVEYRELAERVKVPFYKRIPTPGIDRGYIGALASLVRGEEGPALCPATCHKCPRRQRQQNQQEVA